MKEEKEEIPNLFGFTGKKSIGFSIWNEKKVAQMNWFVP